MIYRLFLSFCVVLMCDMAMSCFKYCQICCMLALHGPYYNILPIAPLSS
jgi:hypothetical protein